MRSMLRYIWVVGSRCCSTTKILERKKYQRNKKFPKKWWIKCRIFIEVSPQKRYVLTWSITRFFDRSLETKCVRYRMFRLVRVIRTRSCSKRAEKLGYLQTWDCSVKISGWTESAWGWVHRQSEHTDVRCVAYALFRRGYDYPAT